MVMLLSPKEQEPKWSLIDVLEEAQSPQGTQSKYLVRSLAIDLLCFHNSDLKGSLPPSSVLYG